jgi:hypothetical protein
VNVAENLLERVRVLVTIAGSAATALVAIYALRRQERSTRAQWLKEQRRDAYVDFLNETWSAYETISARSADSLMDDGSQGSRDADGRRDIEAHLNRANHAAAVVRIVGPQDMAVLANVVLPRLRLDRDFYSPNRDARAARAEGAHTAACRGDRSARIR